MPVLIEALKSENKTLPFVPLRNMVPFPHVEMQLLFGRKASINALLQSFRGDRNIIVAAQKTPQTDNPKLSDIYKVGVSAKIEHLLQVDGNVHAVVRGQKRVQIKKFKKIKDHWEVEVAELEDQLSSDEDIKIASEHLVKQLKKAYALGKHIEFLSMMRLGEGIKPLQLVNQVAHILDATISEKQTLLEISSLEERIKEVSRYLVQEIKIIDLEKSIETKTQAKFDKGMKRAVLQSQKKEIEKELKKLGVTSDEPSEIKNLSKQLKKARLTKEAAKKAKQELKRLTQMPSMAPEASYIRTYLEWFADLPWSHLSPNNASFQKATKILDEDHYALKDVKERIIEYLAVMKLKKKQKQRSHNTNILCFIGPPGVGKTSIGKSIAKALGRKFVRISLGGIRDEAEIRGHRRTYVGAMPGRIVQGIKNAGTRNPVFMLDEIDKIGNDFRGDPSAALLEALDPEQNSEFSDHYLEVPFNLSKVFFIVTGNILSSIPSALRDRLEIITFSGYTQDEKYQIATKHLLKKQLKANGLTDANLKIEKEALNQIIASYTREAGVRELERVIAQVARKIAKKIVTTSIKKYQVTDKNLSKLLGPAKFSSLIKGKKNESGTATGLAWTQAGGDILFVEVALMPGKGQLYLTGKLGEVMKESCRAAISYVRNHWRELGLKDKDFNKKTDVHIHVPEGAVPKDGPSAGIAITTALVSALTGKKVKRDVGMTGEVTLRGHVLEIGGLKEKAIAAHRAGLKTVIIPKDNKKSLVDIPKEVKKDIKFIPVEKVSQVLAVALI
jgi:ATP-dependent Lon protease